jgi:hypothetical protein
MKLPRFRGSIWVTSILLQVLFGNLLGGLRSARGMTINAFFDSSTSAAPAGFFTAFNDVIQFYEASFSDPITINLRVGWGTINGFPLDPGALGESSSMQQQFFTYDQIKSALIGDAKSADDITSIAHLPATDPTGGAHFTLTNAQAKALGLLGANLKGLDGAVGFDSSAAYTFDPNNRGVPGGYDFLGVASHEITEVMGRYGLGENGFPTDHYSPLDLFRYTSPGCSISCPPPPISQSTAAPP